MTAYTLTVTDELNISDNVSKKTIVSLYDINNFTKTRYTGLRLYVGDLEGDQNGLFISPNGLKLYIIGHQNKTVYQYTLSIPFKISTATYDSVSYTITATGGTFDIFFKPDGTAMYVSYDATGGNVLKQYTLSTAWDISTSSLYATYTGDNWGAVFSSDGTKMYRVYFNTHIKEYVLSTPWDISTASYSSQFDHSSQMTTDCFIVSFNSIGTKMYLNKSNYLYEYDLSTAWDLSTASYNGINSKFNNTAALIYNLKLVNNDNYMYIMKGFGTNAYIYQYSPNSNLKIEDSLTKNTEKLLTDTLSISDGLIANVDKDINGTITINSTVGTRFYIDGEYFSDYVLYFNAKVSHKDIGYFTAKLIGLSSSDLTHVSEGKTFLISINDKIPFVGKIEKITPNEDYTWDISGNGFIESMLYNQQVNPTASTTSGSGYGRPQYDLVAVNTVTSEQLTGSGVTLVTDGTYTYPNVTIRADFDNKLSFLNGCADLTDLIWYVKYGSVTKSGTGGTSSITLSTPQFYLVPETYILTTPITGLYTESPKIGWSTTYNQQVEEFSEETDLEQCWNSVYALGYGDGINQLYSRLFDSTNNRTYLSADLDSSSASATVNDGSVLPASGYVWIGIEYCAFTRSGNTLTLTRSTADSSVTIGGISYSYKKAYAHRKGIYVQDAQYGESNYESGVNTSIETYGLKQHSVTDKRIIDQDSLDWFCQRIFDNHYIPPGRIFVTMNDPNLGYLEDFEIYKNYSLYDPNLTGVDGDYTLYSKEYTYDNGYFVAKYEFSNVTYDLMKILRETKATEDTITKYMQGSTNIYQVNQAENCDATHPLEMKFFIPGDTVALNKLKLNFKIEAFRAYETTTASTNTTNQDLIGQSMASWYSLSMPSVKEESILWGTSKTVINSMNWDEYDNLIYSSTTWAQTNTDTQIPSGMCDGSCGSEVVSWYNTDRIVTTAGDTYNASNVCANLDYGTTTVINGTKPSFTWGTPIYTSATIPSQSTGTFSKTVALVHLANETNASRTWTWALRLGSTSGTVVASGSWSAGAFQHTTLINDITTDYTGQELFLVITTVSFNGTTQFDGSFIQLFIYTMGTQTTSHSHAITYGIYEESYTNPSVQVHVKKDGGTYSLVGTYTSDQSNLDITSLFDGTKDTWYYVKFTPNQRQRIDTSLFVQLFINSR